MIGGRNKYMINGVTAQQSRVQNLFHSVQLNVNNPHFLIMQGRITKVLNMKPEEILAMMEEAAGTRMYEMKKVNAQKTIAKKQTRVDEIDKANAMIISKSGTDDCVTDIERRDHTADRDSAQAKGPVHPMGSQQSRG